MARHQSELFIPGRVKRSEAAAYLVRPVNAPRRSPTDEEIVALVAAVMAAEPASLAVALALLSERLGSSELASTYRLHIALVEAMHQRGDHSQFAEVSFVPGDEPTVTAWKAR